jgi:hypothetical protein
MESRLTGMTSDLVTGGSVVVVGAGDFQAKLRSIIMEAAGSVEAGGGVGEVLL